MARKGIVKWQYARTFCPENRPAYKAEYALRDDGKIIRKFTYSFGPDTWKLYQIPAAIGGAESFEKRLIAANFSRV